MRVRFAFKTRCFLLAVIASACAGAGEEGTTTTAPSTTTPAPTTTTTAGTTTTTIQEETTTTAEPARLWEDVTSAAIGTTEGWSNKVDLADLDGDGDVDILVADGGDYDQAGDPLVSQIWINDGAGVFADQSVAVLGDTGSLVRVMKARDVNGDELVDIILGTTFERQSRLFGRGGLEFEEVLVWTSRT